MEIILSAVAIVLATLMISGWLLLLLFPVVTLSATAVGGVVTAGTRFGLWVPGFARDTVRGILCIDGLASRHALRLRSELARVFQLAPEESNPRACACVKEQDGSFLGVLRVFNRNGHYLLRASGRSARDVASQFLTTLDGFEDRFPAKVGAKRESCPECNPATCPLVRKKRERMLAAKPV